MTQSAARWMGRWAVGAALGQILFGGAVRLVLVALLGAALGGLGVWLVQRRTPTPQARRTPTAQMRGRTPTAQTRENPSPGPGPRVRQGAARLDTNDIPVRVGRVPGSPGRRRYSPLARPFRPEAPGSAWAAPTATAGRRTARRTTPSGTRVPG